MGIGIRPARTGTTENPKPELPSVLNSLKQSLTLNREFKVKQDKCAEVR